MKVKLLTKYKITLGRLILLSITVLPALILVYHHILCKTSFWYMIYWITPLHKVTPYEWFPLFHTMQFPSPDDLAAPIGFMVGGIIDIALITFMRIIFCYFWKATKYSTDEETES